jgi:hypothetical protein
MGRLALAQPENPPEPTRAVLACCEQRARRGRRPPRRACCTGQSAIGQPGREHYSDRESRCAGLPLYRGAEIRTRDL